MSPAEVIAWVFAAIDAAGLSGVIIGAVILYIMISIVRNLFQRA